MHSSLSIIVVYKTENASDTLPVYLCVCLCKQSVSVLVWRSRIVQHDSPQTYRFSNDFYTRSLGRILYIHTRVSDAVERVLISI